LFSALRLNDFSVPFAKRGSISIVWNQPASVLTFYQVSQFMQQHEYARFSGVWQKAADRGDKGLSWKHLGFEERARGIDCCCGKQTISAVFFCLVEISKVAGHLNPGPAVVKQVESELISEPAQHFLGHLRVAIEAATRVIFREDADCVLKGLLEGRSSFMCRGCKPHPDAYRIVALGRQRECFLLSVCRHASRYNFRGYQEGRH
jgi:hypothetical protein